MVKRKRSKCHGNSCKRNKSQLSPAILFQKQSKIEKQKIVVKCERHLQNTLEKLRKTAFSCENSRFSLSFVAKKDTSAYVNLMFYSFILRNILSTMCTIADIRWLCYTFNILLPRIQAIY